jgi:hypothetical protein
MTTDEEIETTTEEIDMIEATNIAGMMTEGMIGTLTSKVYYVALGTDSSLCAPDIEAETKIEITNMKGHMITEIVIVVANVKCLHSPLARKIEPKP